MRTGQVCVLAESGQKDRGGEREMEVTSGKLIEKDGAEVIKPVARYAKAAVEITRSEKT